MLFRDNAMKMPNGLQVGSKRGIRAKKDAAEKQCKKLALIAKPLETEMRHVLTSMDSQHDIPRTQNSCSRTSYETVFYSFVPRL